MRKTRSAYITHIIPIGPPKKRKTVTFSLSRLIEYLKTLSTNNVHPQTLHKRLIYKNNIFKETTICVSNIYKAAVTYNDLVYTLYICYDNHRMVIRGERYGDCYLISIKNMDIQFIGFIKTLKW